MNITKTKLLSAQNSTMVETEEIEKVDLGPKMRLDK